MYKLGPGDTKLTVLSGLSSALKRRASVTMNENLEINNTLNPKLWDLKSETLLPDVKDKLIEIVVAFEDFVNIPIDIVDVQIVGSNASYNYTEFSDVDLHIIANFESITDEGLILQALYDSKKTQFNKQYDISIHGVDVEVYVQDIKSGIQSNGIYSICFDEWVKHPVPIQVEKFDTTDEVNQWKKTIKRVLDNPTLEIVQNCIDKLYIVRHNSIAADGEHSKGNQIFKDVRNLGLLDDLKAELNRQISKKLTLEGLELEDEDYLRYLIKENL